LGRVLLGRRFNAVLASCLAGTLIVLAILLGTGAASPTRPPRHASGTTRSAGDHPPASVAADDVISAHALSCGCISRKLFPYQSYTPGAVSVVRDPHGSGQQVLKFAVANTDRPYPGATNPRADIETPGLFMPGDEDYIAIPVLVPRSTPPVRSNDAWFNLAEIYGSPWNGSPAVSLGLSDYRHRRHNHFMMNQDAHHHYHRAWTGPAATDDGWHTIIFHVKFEPNNTGFVQIYFDGKLQKFTNHSTTLHEATLDPGITWDGSANYLDIQSYRSAGSFPGTVTTYMGAPRIGRTLASVK
jgi:Polysaccharide lyase